MYTHIYISIISQSSYLLTPLWKSEIFPIFSPVNSLVHSAGAGKNGKKIMGNSLGYTFSGMFM